MLKRAFIISLLLFIAIGSLLFWQWKLYSNQIEESPDVIENVEQNISIEVKDNSLHVTQNIDGLLSGQEYEVNPPSNVKEWSGAAEQKSRSQESDGNIFLAKDGSLFFFFQIPITMENKPFLLNDWIGVVKDTSIDKTSIEIANASKRKGSWIASIPLKGGQKLEYIDYYAFQGEGGMPSLYWHPASLRQENYQNGKISIFYEEKKPFSYSFSTLGNITNFPYTSLVLTNQFQEIVEEGLIIADNSSLDAEKLEERLVQHYFLSKFEELPKKDRWLAEVLTSLFLDKQCKSEKGMKLIQELKNNLTEKEVQEFLDFIIAEKGILSTEIFDEYLGEIKDKSTRFFSLNKDESLVVIPLYFYDAREVYVEGNLQENIEVIYSDEEKFFPVKETFQALGYEIKTLPDRKTVLLSKDSDSYRFYKDQNIFIYNDEDYGLLERPLRVFNGKMFIKEKWLSTIFYVLINEDVEKLELLIVENAARSSF